MSEGSKSLMDRLHQSGDSKGSQAVNEMVKQFLSGENYDTATEMVNPDGMTFSDFTTLFLADEKTQRKVLGIKGNRAVTDYDLLNFYLIRNRKNWIPNMRKSIQEGVQVAISAVQEEKEKSRREKAAEGLGIR